MRPEIVKEIINNTNTNNVRRKKWTMVMSSEEKNIFCKDLCGGVKPGSTPPNTHKKKTKRTNLDTCTRQLRRRERDFKLASISEPTSDQDPSEVYAAEMGASPSTAKNLDRTSRT